jgi:hypothetical protein
MSDAPVTRPWVKLYARTLADDQFLDLSPEAALLFVLGLARAGADGTDGEFPSRPRSIARWTPLSEAQAEAAVAELVAEGMLVVADTRATYPHWSRYQEPTTRLVEKRKAGAERKARFDARRREAAATEIAGSADPDLDAAGVRDRVRTWLDQACQVAGADVIDAYRLAYTELVPEAAKRYAPVKGIGEASLLNVVVEHAAKAYGLDTDDTATLRRLAGLRKDHGFEVVEALPAACQQAAGDPLAYLGAMLRKDAA